MLIYISKELILNEDIIVHVTPYEKYYKTGCLVHLTDGTSFDLLGVSPADFFKQILRSHLARAKTAEIKSQHIDTEEDEIHYIVNQLRSIDHA